MITILQNGLSKIRGVGAIIGDFAGSSYEFQHRAFNSPWDISLFPPRSLFTDDTIMTLAVAAGLSETLGLAQEETRKALIKNMIKLGRMYPHAGYGKGFRKWFNNPVPYESYGNGSAMRVSPAAWLYNDLEEVLLYAKLTAEVSHNHPEGIKGAQAVAAAIFLARNGADKKQIQEFITNRFAYDLTKNIAEWRKLQSADMFDISCQTSVPKAFAAFFEGNSFEEVIRLAIFLGGDTDTIAAIGGSMAEAHYQIPDSMLEHVLNLLPAPLAEVFCSYEEILQKQN